MVSNDFNIMNGFQMLGKIGIRSRFIVNFVRTVFTFFFTIDGGIKMIFKFRRRRVRCVGNGWGSWVCCGSGGG